MTVKTDNAYATKVAHLGSIRSGTSTTGIWERLISQPQWLANMTMTAIASKGYLWFFRLLPVAIVLSPCFLAIGVHFLKPVLAVSPVTAKAPALAFDQYLVDQGVVRSAGETRAVFAFANRSTGTVQITAVEPSCGCLAPRLEKGSGGNRHANAEAARSAAPATSDSGVTQTSATDADPARQLKDSYGPGETGKLVVRMQAATELPGKKDYFVMVKYRSDDQPEEQSVRLQFRAIVPNELLTVEPRSLIFYQLAGTTTTQSLRVVDKRGRQTAIEDIRVIPPIVEAKQGISRKLESGNIEHEILVTAPADAPERPIRAWLEIQTDDPEARRLRVAIMVRGPDASTKSAPPSSAASDSAQAD